MIMTSDENDRFTEFGNLVSKFSSSKRFFDVVVLILYSQVVTTANAMANDSTLTTLGVEYKASSVAAACVCLSLKTQGFKALSLEKWVKKWAEESQSDVDPRFQAVSITKEQIEGSLYFFAAV